MVDIEARTNGSHHQSAGRDVPELPEFTFPDSKKTVRIRRFTPFVINDIQRALAKEFPTPEPPMNEVDYGDGKKVTEPNPADPQYINRLRAHESLLGQETTLRFTKLIARRGIECEVEAAAIAEIRADMAELGVTFEGESDQEIYFRYVLVQTDKDMEAVQNAVLSRSQPTEAAIADNVTAFRPNVSGT